MQAKMRVLAVVACLVGLSAGIPRPLQPTPRFMVRRQVTQPSTTLDNLILDVGLDLAYELKTTENLVLSPLSINLLLSLLLAGTRGASYQQLYEALRLPAGIREDRLHSLYRHIITNLNQTDGSVQVNIANGLFYQNGAAVLDDYVHKAKTYYNTEVRKQDFSRDPFTATRNINSWVSGNTNGKIPQLFTQPLSSETTFVAVNTVFFNGTWENFFIPEGTRLDDFNTGKTTVQVPMMNTMMTVPYLKMDDLGAEMIALPYKGGRYAMYIVKPTGPVTSDIKNFELQFDAATVKSKVKDMTPVLINIGLPKMRLSFKSSLKDALIALDVKDIFNQPNHPTNPADFGRLSQNSRVWVDDIVHETVIEITETGTIAAAATSTNFNRIGTSRIFRVNRPSILFIRDSQTGVTLFYARLVNPEPLG